MLYLALIIMFFSLHIVGLRDRYFDRGINDKMFSSRFSLIYILIVVILIGGSVIKTSWKARY